MGLRSASGRSRVAYRVDCDGPLRVRNGRTGRGAERQVWVDSLRFPPPLNRCRKSKRSQESDMCITDPPLSQALAAFGRTSRGISSGSTRSWMERAFPGVRLINPFSESVTSI